MEETKRLHIYPASDRQMEAMIAAEPDPELKKAYGEMLELSRQDPERRDWYAAWIIETQDGTPVGDLCFKGLSEDGIAEIGYGIHEEYQGCGYATEAVLAALRWAFRHPEAAAVEAETDPENSASQRVLEKCGFLPNGKTGEEGPRFTLTRERFLFAEGLTTERLILDAVRETDKEDYFNNISHDKKVLETFICSYAETLEAFDFSRYPGRAGIWAVRLKETGRLIGILTLFDETESSCEIGYGIGSAWWGKGYATEAVRRFLEYLFRERGFRRVYASFFSGNDASRRVMEKCGMGFDHFSEKELSYLGVERDLSYYVIDKESFEKPVFRRFQPGDYEAVCRFLAELNRENRDHINWNWARFEWMYEHPDCDKSLLGSIGLWFAGERVVGAAIYDMYFGEAFCGVLPDYADLYPAVLDYAWEALRDENGLGIAICDGSEAERGAALAAGFSPADQTETILRIELEAPFPVRLPDGLRFASPDPIADAEALQWLFWRGFDHGEDRTEFELQKSPPSGPRPHFDPRLSVAAADESGELAACCCLWYLPGTDYAYVEPVCTVPGWRGKGVGRAVVTEALNRARSLGAARAYVISDQEFYDRLGFVFDRHYGFYWRKA